MLMVNVWPFVIIAVLVAPATLSSEKSGESYLMLEHLNNFKECTRNFFYLSDQTNIFRLSKFSYS